MLFAEDTGAKRAQMIADLGAPREVTFLLFYTVFLYRQGRLIRKHTSNIRW